MEIKKRKQNIIQIFLCKFVFFFCVHNQKKTIVFISSAVDINTIIYILIINFVYISIIRINKHRKLKYPNTIKPLHL